MRDFHETGSLTLGALAISMALAVPARAQWSSDPAANTPVAVGAGEQVLPKVAVTPDGLTWVGWFDHASGNYDVRVQLLDQAGVPLLPVGGQLVSAHPSLSLLSGQMDWDLLADAEGNCVLVFSDARAGSDLDVYAYRIDGAGSLLWGPDGVTLSSNDDFEPAVRVAQLVDGRFVFVWSRRPSSGTGELRMQVLDAAGAKQLGPDGTAQTGATNETPGFCDVVPALGGGWIVSWVRDIGSSAILRHVRARRYMADGVPLWPAPVSVFDRGSVPVAYEPQIVSNGANGALIAWHHPTEGVFDVRVQSLDAFGNELYPHNGVVASLEALREELFPALAFDAATGECNVYYVVRDQGPSRWGLSAQRLSPGGARLWGDSGKALLPFDGVLKGPPSCVPFGGGAEVLLFDQPDVPQLCTRVLALRVDAAGQLVWGSSPAMLCSTLSRKVGLAVGVDGAGSAVAVWEDERNDSGDVFAQNVHADGGLGLVSGCSVSTYCIGAPNSVGAGARIGASGGASLELANFTLEASGSPPGSIGIFYFGDSQAQVPFGDGFRCVGGTIGRILPPNVISPAGTAAHLVDFDLPPATLIAAGSTWNFQFWYRDPAGPLGTSFNLSDALTATFCP
jgi:hypothetical protein